MKLYTDYGISDPDEPGKLRYILLSPPSNGPKTRKCIVLLHEKALPGGAADGAEISAGMVGKEKKTLMIFPPDSKPDNRVLVLGKIPQPGHRRGAALNGGGSGKVLFESTGYGAWGYGACFAAILQPGEWVASTSKIAWKNENGVLVRRSFSTDFELSAFCGGGAGEIEQL